LKGDGYELVFIEDSPQRKRIRMAMSEGDHSAAIVWLLQQTETKDSTSVRAQRSKELNAILNGSSKAESPVMMRFLIESVIDKLDRWSRKVSKDRFLSTLDVLVSGLALFRNSVASSSSHAAVMEASLFRARSYQYTWANHSGDSVMASELAAKLESSMEIARSDPNILEAIFQYQIGLTEQAINDHEFERAEKLALDHAEFVSASTSAATDSSSVQPCQPHVLRMVCVKLRAMALAEVSRMDYEMLELVQEECHKEIVSLELNHGPEAPVNDLVRLLAVESYCAEVLGDIGTLKSICSQLCEIVGERPRELPYATALLLRNAATISLISRSDKEAQLLVQKCIQDFSMQLIDAGDFKHPQEIIVREWLIWAHCHSLLASAEWDKALDLLEASAISLGQASRVLDHQAKVASAVSKFIRSEQVKCSESGQQLSRFDRNMGNGIGASEAQLLGIRSETVY
jgi:hypothetical protein